MTCSCCILNPGIYFCCFSFLNIGVQIFFNLHRLCSWYRIAYFSCVIAYFWYFNYYLLLIFLWLLTCRAQSCIVCKWIKIFTTFLCGISKIIESSCWIIILNLRFFMQHEFSYVSYSVTFGYIPQVNIPNMIIIYIKYFCIARNVYHLNTVTIFSLLLLLFVLKHSAPVDSLSL